MKRKRAIPEQSLRKALEAVIGEPALLAADVDWDLKQPCDDCPFLRTSAFHGGVARSLPDYVASIENNRFAHTCHKTDCRRSVDGPKTFKGTPKHCAGALMMLLKTGNGADLQLPLLEALEASKWDGREMTIILTLWLACATINALISAAVLWLDDSHTPQQRRRLIVECAVGSLLAAPLLTVLLLLVLVVMLAVVLTEPLT